MTKQEERYKAWVEASEKAFLEGDVDAQVSIWAEDCTRTAIAAFGDIIRSRGARQFAKQPRVGRRDLKTPDC